MAHKYKSIGNTIYLFQTFKKVNIATFLYKHLSSSILKKWFYFALPIIFFSGNILVMMLNNVFYSKCDVFTYIKDYSNSIGLSILYFLSYFLSGYYPSKYEEFVKNDFKQDYLCKVAQCSKSKEKSIPCLVIIGLILFIVGIIAGLFFYNKARTNINSYWTYNLSFFGKIYYCIFLSFTWYQSISLLMMVLISGVTIYLSLIDNAIVYNDKDFNKNISIMDIADLVISNFSYGIFYIIGAILFILNDLVAKEYNVYNIFSNYKASFMLIFVILMLLLLIFIPFQELRNFMKIKKTALIKEYNEKIAKLNQSKYLYLRGKAIQERDNLILQNLFFTSVHNKIIFILSVVVPSIGVIFQTISLFKS